MYRFTLASISVHKRSPQKLKRQPLQSPHHTATERHETTITHQYPRALPGSSLLPHIDTGRTATLLTKKTHPQPGKKEVSKHNTIEGERFTKTHNIPTRNYYYTCAPVRCPKFNEKPSIHCKTPSLEGTPQTPVPPPPHNNRTSKITGIYAINEIYEAGKIDKKHPAQARR